LRKRRQARNFAVVPHAPITCSTHPEVGTMNEQVSGVRFVPKGAIAFFVALAVLYAMLWFAMYAELLGRR
jgi:hypothetical protein